MAEEQLLIGCYTPPDGTGHGITTAALTDAALTDAALTDAVPGTRTGAVPSPSFLALHPTLPLVYAVAEHSGRLVTLRREDAALTVVDDRSTGGQLTCHVALSPDERWVAAANYGDGSVAVFPLGADGIPVADAQVLRHSGTGPVPDRQAGPHCHQVTFDGMLLTVTDLGADRIRRHVLEGAQWVPAPAGDVQLRAGSGPRHQVVDGRVRYVVGELGGEVASYRVDDSTGAWTEVARARTTNHDGPSYPSHIVLRDGHLYVGNRGADTIGVLAVTDGVLVLVGETPTGGVWPRHFAFVGGRIVVANERSHELTVLEVPAGSPVPVAMSVGLRTGSPTCVVPLT